MSSSGNVSLAGRKRRAASSVTATPEKKLRLGPVVTPEKSSGKASSAVVVLDAADEDDEAPQQPALEGLLRFTRSMVEGLSAARRAVVERLQANYVVPADLATNKIAYGPISGQSMGSRLIVAYESGKLVPRRGKLALTLCSACGADGHRASNCANPSGA